MCTFDKKSKKKTAVCYKVALKVGKQYYSPVTGIEYRPGKVPVAKEYGEHNVRKAIGINDVINVTSMSYKDEYAGMTAGFVLGYNALTLRNRWRIHLEAYGIRKKLVVLEINLTGTIFTGVYTMECVDRSVYIGSDILSLREVKISELK